MKRQQLTRPSFSICAALVAWAVACTGMLIAQTAPTPPSPLPPAKEVIEKYVKAVGGREAVLTHSSHHAKCRMDVPAQGIAAEMEIFAAKPNKILVRQTIPGLGQVIEAFDGTIGWSLNPALGPRLLQGKELAQARTDADFYDTLRDGKDFKSMDTVELAKFDGKDCYKLRLVRLSDDESFEFYDKDTGLRAGSVKTRESPMGSITVTSIESDYKPFGGVLVPTRMVTKAMGLEMVVTVTAIDFDLVDDAVFAVPPEIKPLIKQDRAPAH